jgi:hypothetical protein
MKLTNYKRQHNYFDCSIHGTIKMTGKEWAEVCAWLMSRRKLFDSYGGDFMKKIFIEDTNRQIKIKEGKLINIRVIATEALAEKWGLKNYKRGNYQILILN